MRDIPETPSKIASFWDVDQMESVPPMRLVLISSAWIPVVSHSAEQEPSAELTSTTEQGAIAWTDTAAILWCAANAQSVSPMTSVPST